MKNRKSVIFYMTSRTYEAFRDADVAELADALGSGPSSPKECGFKSHRRYQFVLNVLRVWHNGCAPAFQAGHGGSTPPTRSKYAVVEFPSGQRGQTVNLLSPTSMVRIHLPPPFLTIQSAEKHSFFLSKNGVWKIVAKPQ